MLINQTLFQINLKFGRRLDRCSKMLPRLRRERKRSWLLWESWKLGKSVSRLDIKLSLRSRCFTFLTRAAFFFHSSVDYASKGENCPSHFEWIEPFLAWVDSSQLAEPSILPTSIGLRFTKLPAHFLTVSLPFPFLLQSLLLTPLNEHHRQRSNPFSPLRITVVTK